MKDKKNLTKFAPALPLLLALLGGLLLPPFLAFLKVCLGEIDSIAKTLEMLQSIAESWVGTIVSCATLLLVYMYLTYVKKTEKYQWLLPVTLGWYALSLIGLVEYNAHNMIYFIEKIKYLGNTTLDTFYILGNGIFGFIGVVIAALAFLGVVYLVVYSLGLLDKVKKLKTKTASMLALAAAALLVVNGLWDMLESGYFWLILFIERMEYAGSVELTLLVRELYYVTNMGINALIRLMLPIAVFLLFFFSRKDEKIEIFDAPEEHMADVVTEEESLAENEAEES